MDNYTETNYTGYGQNIGNSFKGMFVGLVLLIGSIVLIWWNEGRSVTQANALEEMQKKIHLLSAPVYDALLEDKPVLVQGEVTPIQRVMDTEFEVSTDGLVLQRTVEMYQWKETTHSHSKDTLGGGTETVTTYEYSKTWSKHPIDSSFFKHRSGHENPPMNYHSATFSSPAMLGDFHLDKGMIEHISANIPYDGLAKMPQKIGAVTNYKQFLYLGENPASPKVGEIKIIYTYAPSGVYTFAGKESGKRLVPYRTSNGKALVFVRKGRVTAEKIFKEELDANSTLTWVLRVAGLSLMFIGFSLIMEPLQTFVKVIPALGSLVGGVTGIIAGILTLILGSLIIAIAWMGARPMLSLGLIGGGVVIAFLLGKFGKKKSAKSHFKKSTTATSHRHPATSATPPPRKSTPPPRV